MPIFSIENGQRDFDRFNSPSIVNTKSIPTVSCTGNENNVENPFTGTLVVEDLETSETFSLNADLARIDNITSATQGPDITNVSGLIKVPEIAVDRILDTTQATFIDLDGLTVAVNANDLTLNGDTVANTANTLQSVYDTSTPPIITTNATLGSVQIQRGSLADTDNVLEIKDGIGVNTVEITGEGSSIFNPASTFTLPRTVVIPNLSSFATTITNPGTGSCIFTFENATQTQSGNFTFNCAQTIFEASQNVKIRNELQMQTNPIKETTFITPVNTDLYDLGSSLLKYKDIHLKGQVLINDESTIQTVTNRNAVSNLIIGDGGTNITGINSIIIGNNTLPLFTTGSSNVAIGRDVGENIIDTASFNVFIGDGVTSSSGNHFNCVFIGSGSGSSGVTNPSNIIAIGSGAINNENDTCLIGTSFTTSIRGGGNSTDLGTIAKPFNDLHLKGDILTTQNITSKTTDTYDIGSSLLKYKDIHLSGQVLVNDESTVQTITSYGGSNNFVIGNGGASLSGGFSNILIGQNTGLNLEGGVNNICFGSNALQQSAEMRNSVIMGTSTFANNTNISSTLNVAIGQSILTGVSTSQISNSVFLGTGSGGTNLEGRVQCVYLGSNSGSTTTQTNTGVISIGYNAINDDDDTCVIGNGSLSNIRSMANCDLGTTDNKFKDLYLSGETLYPNAWSELYMENNATATVITTLDTWTKILGTTTANTNNQSFTHTNNLLTYTGTRTSIFMCEATFSFTPASSANIEWTFGFAKNGTFVPGSSTRIHSITNGYHYSSAIHKVITLAETDTLSLYCKNRTNTVDLTVTEINMSCHSQPNVV